MLQWQKVALIYPLVLTGKVNKIQDQRFSKKHMTRHDYNKWADAMILNTHLSLLLSSFVPLFTT